jgi:DNA-binding FrmR family transcriptional regulator
MTDKLHKPEAAGLGRYLKEAFLWKWNILLLLGSAAAGLISGYPDIALPIVGAAELAYLAGLTSIPRFRSAIDAKAHAEKAGAGAAAGGPAKQSMDLGQMIAGLSPAARERFRLLRDRCLEMRRIARGVRGGAAGSGGADELRTPALDRLLWTFLRLLHSQQALDRFLASTEEGQIRDQIAKLEKEKTSALEKKSERIVRSLEDSIATAQLRLDNYGKSESNAELVRVELDRIEGKIQALTEMAVSHQDPDYISSQVDSVAASMQHTEEAMRELEQITGIRDEMQETPEILEANLEKLVEA